MISLNLEQPSQPMRADYESNAPTGVSTSDIASMEQFLIGVRTHTGQVVTPERAKRCSAVLAILRGLSEDISTLPIDVFKHGTNGPEPFRDHPVHRLLSIAPNDIMTPMELREHIFYDMVLHGGFYVLKNEDPDNPGQLGSLWPLQAQYVVRQWRQMLWTFTDETTGAVGNFTPDLVWRGSILSANGIDGAAITLLAREAIGILLAAEEQAARLFKQGVQTDLALSTPDVLEEPTKLQLREAFMRRHAGSGNAWMPILLEGGLSASRIGLTAQESQYMESRGFQISDIARIFRYPEVLLGSTGKSSKSATYASAEQFFQSYTKHTLTPWAVRIEQTIHRDLFTPKERAKLFVKHNFSTLLVGDTAARYASYATGIASGFLSPGECRKAENKPFVAGLDYYTKPMNMTATAGGDAAATKPTDVSGALPEGESVMARRVANIIMQKEYKALSTEKDADIFYANFAGFVGDMTGADGAEVRTYLESRRTDTDRFSTQSQETAIAALISLCKG